MFEDVPEELNRDVLARTPLLSDPSLISLMAAKVMTRFYLGTDLVEKDNFLPDRPKQFPTTLSARYSVRISQIAEAVFSLRNEPGFPEITRRLASRDLQSAFFEARTASEFKSYGLTIFARPETKTLSEDFDFSVGHEEIEINVEATQLQDTPNFSDTTIRNTLHRKRKQLSPELPAVIVCWIPSQWRAGAEHFEEKVGMVVKAFLRGTHRINCVLIAEDIHYRRGNNFGMMSNFLPYLNEHPRHDAPSLTEMLDLAFKRSPAVRHGIRGPAPRYGGGSGDFFRWLDWLMTRQTDRDFGHPAG